VSDQPVFMARLAALLEELGDDRPAFGQLERGVIPVVLVGDGREVVPPMFAARSFAGTNQAGGGTGATHAAVQITARSPGGLYVSLDISSPSTGNIPIQLTTSPVTMASVITALDNVQVEPGALFTMDAGTLTFGTTFPVGTLQTRLAANSVITFACVIPNGSTLELAHSVNNAAFNVSADLRNLSITAKL